MDTVEIDGVECVVIHLAESMEKPFINACAGEDFDLPSQNETRPLALCEPCRLTAMFRRSQEKILNLNETMDLETGVGVAIGAASMCWEDPSAGGVFDSTRAKTISDELLEFIRSKVDKEKAKDIPVSPSFPQDGGQGSRVGDTDYG